MSEEVQGQAEAMEMEIETLVEDLSGARRRQRQDASHRLAIIARQDSSLLHAYVDALVDAIYRPEAQTRWEVLDALSEIVADKSEALEGAYEGAETSLFDEGSSTVRLSAFRYLSRYGATQTDRSEQVWGILDEAVQCYHGDPDYRDMLVCLRDFAAGSISPAVRKALVTRIKFDADSGRGSVKAISEEIIDISKKAEKEAKKAAKAKDEGSSDEEKPAKKSTRKKTAKKDEAEQSEEA